jgi:hypothetical protein
VFPVELQRLRRRYLVALFVGCSVEPAPATLAAALAASVLLGCEERERWPAPERERPLPIPIGAPVLSGDDPECASGRFCQPRPGSVEVGANPPFSDCSVIVPLPSSEARSLPEATRRQLRIRFDDAATARARESGDACCYLWFEDCRGRPLLCGDPRVAVAPRLGRARRRGGFVDPAARAVATALGRRLPARLRARLGRHFATEGAHEHASIASFARHRAALERAGAPGSLIGACRRAENDELRHARIAYGLAAGFSGTALAPEAPQAPELSSDLVAIALDTFVAGCCVETVAAASGLRAASGVADARLRALLVGIARDEERHATLAWRTLGWTLAAGGGRVARALFEHAPRLLDLERRALAQPLRRERSDHMAERSGMLDRAARRQVARLAFDELVVPGTRALLAAATAISARALG